MFCGDLFLPQRNFTVTLMVMDVMYTNKNTVNTDNEILLKCFPERAIISVMTLSLLTLNAFDE